MGRERPLVRLTGSRCWTCGWCAWESSCGRYRWSFFSWPSHPSCLSWY